MTETASGPAARKGRRRGLKIGRINTTPGVHPYDQVAWERRDVVMTNWRDGSVNFEQKGVEFPDFWSVNATNIVTTKYFRGAVGTPRREWSLKQLIDRVTDVYTKTGKDNGYFASEEDAEIFDHELKYALVHQIFSFNSPVWFNVGTASPQQVSACFILAVDDTMDSILDWYREEGLIFKGGSGAGVNLSRIRSSKELLSSGGTASGPVSFMRGADASAGTIKSGGATRRAAKMVVLDVDHPDVEEFIETKAREEEKIRVLRDAGFDMDLGGQDMNSVQYQNANNSVRVSGEFMRAVADGKPFDLLARRTGEVIETVDAKNVFRKMAQAAWACADPGIQYDDTINDWHTNPESGRITASNPCSEYLSLDNSSCNLASINLLKFLREDDTFDTERFKQMSELIITAMDISITFADFPTTAIGDITRAYRQLGIGYANLGALLMATGHAYDSEGGRAIAAAITSLMTGAAYKRSAELARVVGPYDGYAKNADAHKRVIRKHADANRQAPSVDKFDRDILALAKKTWDECVTLGEANGYRNAQASLLAPTGTIGFMMDCDTTGIEPDLALVKFKKLVGGGSMQIVNQTVPRALKNLGYQHERSEAIVEYIAEHGHVVDAPGLRPEHYEVFDCAMGERSISPMGHVRMMAAVQPFLSGSISKTVNMPESATVEDVEEIYFEGWKLGLKALAIYRDNCKVGQPLSVAKKKEEVAREVEEKARELAAEIARQEAREQRPVRKRLPKTRSATVTKFNVAGAEGYMTASSYPDDGVGEVFLKLGKQGSTLAGVMDAFSMAISVGLQYGIPLESYVEKFTNLRFEPAGMTDDPDIRIATSMMDYIFRRLALDHLPFEQRAELGILSAPERAAQAAGQDPAEVDTVALAQSFGGETSTSYPERANLSPQPPAPAQSSPAPAPRSGQPAPGPHSTAELIETQQGRTADAPLCLTCGTKMRPAGSCYVCEGCGSTSGCSLFAAQEGCGRSSAALRNASGNLLLHLIQLGAVRAPFVFPGDVCDYRIMAEQDEWKAIGERVRRTRLVSGMSQAELGKPASLDRTMVAKIEAGTRRISALELTQLSAALNVPIGYLLEPLPEVVSRRGSAADEDFDSGVAQESGRLEIVLATWLSDLRQVMELGVLRPRPLLVSKRSADSSASVAEIALWAREALGCGLGPVGSMAEASERAGQFVLVTEAPGQGASVIDGDIAAAVVSLSGDPGRRRTTAAHELGHLVLGDEYSNDLGVHASRADRENIVDTFAAEFLLPSPVLASLGSGEISRGQLVEVAARYRVSWSLALRQAARVGVLAPESQRDMARSRPTRSEFLDALGWSPQPDLESVRVPPGYAHAVLEALRMAAITPSRAVELLHGQASLADLPADDEADDEP